MNIWMRIFNQTPAARLRPAGRLCLLALALSVLPGGRLAGQEPDRAGAQEIDLCLATLQDQGHQADMDDKYGFQVTAGEDKKPAFRVRLKKHGLELFEGKELTVDLSGGTPDAAVTAGGKKSTRRLTGADFHAFRPFLSLSPRWVLEDVRNRLHQFTYTENDQGQGIYRRYERVPLAALSEQRYGDYEEVLVVDLARHQLESYSVIALDADRVYFRDLLNIYEDGQAKGEINVYQGSNADHAKLEPFVIQPWRQ